VITIADVWALSCVPSASRNFMVAPEFITLSSENKTLEIDLIWKSDIPQ